MDWSIRLDLVPWVIISGALAVLSATIYVRQSASRVARLFCLILAFMSVWFAGFALMFWSSNASLALFSGRVGLCATAFLAATAYDFTVTALRIRDRRIVLVRSVWFVAALFSLGLLFTNAVVADSLYRYSWGFYPRLTPLVGAAFAAFIGLCMLLDLGEYLLEYNRTTDRVRRRRLLQLMVSFLIVAASGVDFRAMFGADRRPLAWLSISAVLLFAWRSIRQHRLHTITAARASSEILETMADALFVIDADARIHVVNGAVRNLFGYSETEILGKSLDILEYIDHEATISRTLRELLARAPVRDQERVFRHKNREPIAVSISISRLRERDIAGGAVVIARDVRERKGREQALEQFTVRLQQSNRELEDFAYVASHDLQEPLRKIQAFGDRLKTKHGAALPAEALDYVVRMQNAANRMQTLIIDLLAFSRVSTKAQPFSKTDLNVIAGEVLHDLEIRISESAAKVEIGELPTIAADPMQMRQLFQNLIGNALKFQKPGEPPIVTVAASTEPEHVEITVRDRGIGFEQKYADRIFTIFERLHGRSGYEGTGIGLAICRKIVERHGGTIHATSVPGEGSTFMIRLPAPPPRGDKNAA